MFPQTASEAPHMKKLAHHHHAFISALFHSIFSANHCDTVAQTPSLQSDLTYGVWQRLLSAADFTELARNPDVGNKRTESDVLSAKMEETINQMSQKIVETRGE